MGGTTMSESERGKSGYEKLDEQARKRVEAVLKKRLASDDPALQELKATVQEAFGEANAPRLIDRPIFLGIWIDEEPIGIWL
jgi:hypothetical protein